MNLINPRCACGQGSLRDIAASLDTERSAFGILTDLAQAGYVVKEKDGRRSPMPMRTPD